MTDGEYDEAIDGGDDDEEEDDDVIAVVATAAAAALMAEVIITLNVEIISVSQLLLIEFSTPL